MGSKVHFYFICFLLLSGVHHSLAQRAVVSDSRLSGTDKRITNFPELSQSDNDSIATRSDSAMLQLDSPALQSDSTILAPDSAKSNAIDAPVQYASVDSMVMVLSGKNKIYLYNEGSVQYQNMDLQGHFIEIDANNNTILATHGKDSIGDDLGLPVFKQGDQQFIMKKARYNFKTKKMLISEVVAQEGEGFMTAAITKKLPNDDMFMKGGRYTTCDHEHPHFYLQMTRGRARPGKNVVFGPAYLVVEDVPLPIALPFGFFPFTSSYSSGVIMPTYGDEMTRGFSLRDGGYYFAFSEHIDLALTGEIYTKGSWGLAARSNYKKRYKYSGSFNASYLVTITGDKGADDYLKSSDFKIAWSHTQDAKSNPFSTFSAQVNFATSSYDRNQISSIYSNLYTQNTKSSNISWRYKHPEIPVSLTANASINQISKDTTLSVTFPNLAITVSEFYPFKRKVQVGNQRWYEKIRMSYTGSIGNSISNVKEYDFFKKNIIKDWKNGMKHSIPISASFNILKYINVSPSVNYTERWYTSSVKKVYDAQTKRLTPADTTYGFHRVYDYSGSISANTKLYGMYKPWGFLGSWTKGVQIRHVLTPSVSFSGSPDFSDPSYGFYREVQTFDEYGNLAEMLTYSPFENQLYGVPGKGKSGSMSFSLENNLEMKLPIAGTDSTRKISLIDNLRLGISHNFLADSMKWSDLSASIRLKLGKSFTLNLAGSFETYTFNEEGVRINVPRWKKAGKGIGRLKSTGTSFSYSLNNETLKKLFSGSKEKGSSPPGGSGEEGGADPSGSPPGKGEEGDIPSRTGDPRKKKESEGDFDSDGYLLCSIPWNLSFNYSLALTTDMSKSAFNKKTREYPYRINQTLGISGNITPTKGWNFSFNTSYDFDRDKFATMQCSLSRQMHCWTMSASIIPIGPYQSYSFSISVSSSMLQDLKYTQSSNYRDAVNWGN